MSDMDKTQQLFNMVKDAPSGNLGPAMAETKDELGEWLVLIAAIANLDNRLQEIERKGETNVRLRAGSGKHNS